MKQSLKILVLAFIPALIIYAFIDLHMNTRSRINEINELKGTQGVFSEIVADFDTWEKVTVDELKYIPIEGYRGNENLDFYKYSGEGFPYFNGYVVYDRSGMIVLDAVARELGGDS